MTPHNLARRRQRLLREISQFAARIAETAPETPRQRATITRAARCLADRARQLAMLPWTS